MSHEKRQSILPPEATRNQTDPFVNRRSDLQIYASQLRDYLSSSEAEQKGHTLDTNVLSSKPLRFECGGRVFGGRFLGEIVEMFVELGYKTKEWLYSAAAILTFAELLELLERLIGGESSAAVKAA